MDTGIELLHFDESIAVCVKPPGMDSQRALPEALRASLGGEVYCLHRLDRDVGGVMVYARTHSAAAKLSAAIASGTFEKQYLAVCAGKPMPETGEMRDLLFHDREKNKTYVVKRLRRGVREAALRYTLLVSDGDASLMRIQLATGRTHQIRVQFASRGMPLLGDAKYGSSIRFCAIALQAESITFPHPRSGAFMHFSVPPPNNPPWTQFDLKN